MTGLLVLMAALAVDCDFSVTDERGGAYGIDIERRSPLSHGHGWIEDGRYKIAVDGNRHFIAAPKVGDFRLEAEQELVLFRLNYTLGYTVFFRWDRVCGTGHRLDVVWDSQRILHFTLDGTDIFTRQDADPLPLKDLKLVLEVSGTAGRIATAGAEATFTLPDDATTKGEVGFDLTVNESEKLYFSKLRFTSPEDPVATKAGAWRFELPREQGFAASPTYEVAAWTYPDGTTRLDLTLDGTVRGRPAREPSGGREWSTMSERLTAPYVRAAADGFTRTFCLWNGERRLFDWQLAQDRKRGLDPWPVRRTFFVRNFPKAPLLAAGYAHAIGHPWRFAEDGPYEQVQDASGRIVYAGEAVRLGKVAVRVKSPADKRLVAKIPADIPDRERALRFAREQHCFFASEPVTFAIETVWRSADFAADEIAVTPRLESVFGAETGIACTVESTRRETLGAGLERRTTVCRLARNPGVGVWHFQVALDAGVADRRDVRTIFEVLSDDPNGPCPPLAAGLPTLVSVPNEIKYLEENAFDPWGEFGGIGHYYAIDIRYPSVADRLRVWELDRLYRRAWWAQLISRNTDDVSLDSPRNARLLANADYLWHLVPGKHREGRFDFCRADFYRDTQFEILRDYIVRERPPLKRLDAAALAAHAAANDGISAEELKEVFDTCWDGFKRYAAARVAAILKAYDDDLLARNPKIARASYGPMPVYTATYKTPYTLETDAHPLDDDPRLIANGSFWIFEDYHYSCDYPILRPAFFVAGYKMLYPNSRRIFPEIYYQGWGRCADGAVYQAHPDKSPYLPATHQRRVVYRYGYATPYFTDGKFAFWRDDGFHARTPEREAMDEFVYAWGKLVANRPAKPLKSPFALVDPDAFRRYGDFFDADGAYALRGPNFRQDVRCEIGNLAEEDVGWAFERCCLEGRATPVVSRLRELDALEAKDCEFVILPPLAPSTPQEVIAAVRRAHERGIALLGFEQVTGLEDLFGEGTDEFLTKETPWGRTALVNARPTLVERMDFKTRYMRGRPTLSARMAKGLKDLMAFLAPRPAVSTERGTITAVRTERDDIVAILEDESPLYGDTTAYPASFRFTVSAPGIGRMELEADAPYNVVTREADRVVIRTAIAKDSALFFRFRR